MLSLINPESSKRLDEMLRKYYKWRPIIYIVTLWMWNMVQNKTNFI